MSYNMNTTCQPHALHMVIQGRVHSSQHGPSVGVYKVNYFVKSSLSSSLMFTLIQEFVLLSHSKDLRSQQKWFNRLQDFTLELDEVGHKLTSKEQRLLKGACKCLKKVDFSCPATRVSEICKNPLELNISIP